MPIVNRRSQDVSTRTRRAHGILVFCIRKLAWLHVCIIRTHACLFQGLMRILEELNSNATSNKTTNSQSAKSPTPQPQQQRHMANHIGSFVWRLTHTASYVTDYWSAQIHDGCLGLSKQDSAEAKQKKLSYLFLDMVPNRKCQTALHFSCTL